MKRLRDVAGDQLPAQIEEQKRGYMARELVQCTLPHSPPATGVLIHKRVDDNLTVSIKADPEYGMPSGSIPRLIMLWVTSEAVRTQNRRLVLASNENNSLSAYLRAVGLNPNTGRGKRGDAKRMQDQMMRLFRSKISFDYKRGTTSAEGFAWLDMAVAPKGNFWWDHKNPDQEALFDSWVELNEDFYKAITSNAVPVNLTIAGKLTRSPLALDLFVWTTYRVFRLAQGQQITVSVTDLHKQFGTEYARARAFKTKLAAAVEKVRAVWPDAPIALTDRGLQLVAIPARSLPVAPEFTGSLTSRRSGATPFELSVKDLIAAEKHSGNWDVRVMRRQWEEWCKAEGITPEKPVAHFIKFLKSHRKSNGNG